MRRCTPGASMRTLLKASEAARSAPTAPQPPRSIDLVLDGLARRCTEGPGAGVPPLRLALQAAGCSLEDTDYAAA